MAAGETLRTQRLPAGSLCLPAHPAILEAVASSSAVVCAFDPRRKRGGMAHYCRPYREKNKPSTAVYAGPAIVGLVRMLEKEGSRPKDLNLHLVGGAACERARGFERGLAENNIKVGLEILGKLGLGSVGMHTGGSEGKRVRFHTGSGELVLATIEGMRDRDWYPCAAEPKASEKQP